jgi:transcription elongation factor Elf1
MVGKKKKKKKTQQSQTLDGPTKTCKKCGHTGATSEVGPSKRGVTAYYCGNCGEYVDSYSQYGPDA